MNGKSFLWVLLAVVVSCSEEIVVKPYEYSSVFTGKNSKTWKVKFLEETLNGEVIDTFTIGCASDDRYTFHNDFEHSFEVVTGNNKCYLDPEADEIKDTWTFTNASATLTMILPFFTPDFSLPLIVREVRGDEMELEIFFGDNTGSYRIHFDLDDED